MYEVLLFSSELKQNDKLILQLIYNLHWRYITGQFLLNVNANFFPWILKSKVKKETLHFWKVTIPMHCINACFMKKMIWSNDDIKFSFKHIITDIQRRQICPLHCVLYFYFHWWKSILSYRPIYIKAKWKIVRSRVLFFFTN